MKFGLLGQFDPPPGKIRVYFLKSSKGGGKGGKGRGKRFGRGGGGGMRKGNLDNHGNWIHNYPFSLFVILGQFDHPPTRLVSNFKSHLKTDFSEKMTFSRENMEKNRTLGGCLTMVSRRKF